MPNLQHIFLVAFWVSAMINFDRPDHCHDRFNWNKSSGVKHKYFGAQECWVHDSEFNKIDLQIASNIPHNVHKILKESGPKTQKRPKNAKNG